MHFSFLCLAATAASAHNVLHVGIAKQALSLQQQKLRLARRDPVAVPLTNQISSYVANVTVGTPPQQLQLIVDTGSSDIWMISSTVESCATSPGCPGGVFNAAQSTTFEDIEQGGFQIGYADGSSAQGDFFTDVIRIGPQGSQVSVNGQQMGIVTDTDQDLGIMGIGFASHESVCPDSGSDSCQTYPTLTQNLVSQGVINTQAYSLWLDDLASNTGSILFGGVDSKKYVGSLVTIPMYPNSETEIYTSFTVAWTGLTLGTSQGSKGGFVSDDFAAGVILDSGTTETYVPDDVAQAIFAQFDAQPYGQDGDYVAACSLSNSTATFDFQFGGSQGPVISVPISELLIPVYDDNGQLQIFTNGDYVCRVGIHGAGDEDMLFGDTILRSAYVVYDLDNQQISMAQTNFDSTGSSIQEIRAGQAVPGTGATATFRSVMQSATGRPGADNPQSAIRGSATPALTGGAPLAQYTAKNTYNPHPMSASSAAAVRQTMPRTSLGLFDGGLGWMAATTATFVAIGGGLLLL